MISRISVVPFLALLAARGINFSAAVNTDVIEDTPAKTVLTVFAYLLATILVAKRPAILPVAMRKFALYALYLLISMATLLWTAYPMIAALRFMHMIGLFLVTVCAVDGCIADGGALIPTVSLTYGTFSILSLFVVLFYPERGLIHAEWSSGGLFSARWVGITGHPNILGASSYVAIWAAAGCLLGPASRWVKIGSVMSIVVSVILLIGSDSRTAQFATGLAIVLTILLRGIRLHSLFARRGLSYIARRPIVWILGGAAILLISTLVVFPGLREMATRDGSTEVLTGRAEIWRAGFDAITEFPFGWGQDQLMTYWLYHNAYEPFPHFHNGFLDLTVRSGLFGGAAMIAFLGLILVWLYRLEILDATLSGPLTAFYLSFLVYNMTETSIDRETVVWPVLFLLALQAAIMTSSRVAGSLRAGLPTRDRVRHGIAPAHVR